MKLVVFGQALLHAPVAWNAKVREIAEGADAILCNFEGCLPPPDAWPMKRKTVHPAGPAALMDLKRLGVTHLALANNHIWDFGHAGIVVTRRAAEAAGFAVAGAGIDRDQARRPAIRNGVALVSVDAGPTPDWAIARAHPGVAALRVRRVLGLPRRDLDLLTEISTDSGEAEGLARRRNIGFDAAVVPPLGLDVIQAPVRQEILSIDDDDLDRLCRDIVAARAEADKVIVAVHYRQWAPDWMRAHDWFTTLTDKALAAGADAVTGTGPPLGAPGDPVRTHHGGSGPRQHRLSHRTSRSLRRPVLAGLARPCGRTRGWAMDHPRHRRGPARSGGIRRLSRTMPRTCCGSSPFRRGIGQVGLGKAGRSFATADNVGISSVDLQPGEHAFTSHESVRLA